MTLRTDVRTVYLNILAFSSKSAGIKTPLLLEMDHVIARSDNGKRGVRYALGIGIRQSYRQNIWQLLKQLPI